MKPWVLIVSLAGLLCLLTPAAAHAATPQARRPQSTHAPIRNAAIRKAPRAPKPPKDDHVHTGALNGTLALVQFFSTRRTEGERLHTHIAPHHSVAQVRASQGEAERGFAAALHVHPVDLLPPHRGATHLCI